MAEITLRTLQGRLLLRPTRAATRTIAGAIGRAQRQTGIAIHAVTAMGNHVHLLISPRDAEQMARFMNRVGSNVARKVGKMVDWRERFWGRRYRAIVVSNEESAQIARLRYLLAHGCKEGFVRRPTDWPGVHAARPLLDSSMQIEGVWHDDSAAYRDRTAKTRRAPSAYEVLETIQLSPLPCWQHLSPATYRHRVGEMIQEIEQETEERHRLAETAPTGPSFVLASDPHERPRNVKRSQAPAFHAASRSAFALLHHAYLRFVSAYRQAGERLRRGETPAVFPAGCFPPALPFVPG